MSTQDQPSSNMRDEYGNDDGQGTRRIDEVVWVKSPNHSNFEQILRSDYETEIVYGHFGFNRYQYESRATAVFPGSNTGSKEAVTYCALKLAGEAGEVAEKIGKYLYRGDRLPDGKTFIEIIKKELGDPLWYIAQMCTELGISLEDLARHNREKLSDRAARGVLKGSGDDR